MSQKTEIILTPEGFLELETELNELKTERRPAVIKALKEARALGDLSENADYDAARNEQAQVEGRIKELEFKLENAIIAETKGKKNTVGIGSVVTIEYVDDNEEEEYKIVGSLEADALNNKISNESPIGKAIYGKKVNEVVNVESPNGYYQVKIVNIA